MKKLLPLLLATILAALVLAACGTTGSIEPEYGDPIPMKVGQPVEITNGQSKAVVEYLGYDEISRQHQWSCIAENSADCAQRHSSDLANIQFFYQTERIGKSDGSNLLLTSDWEVKLYP